MTVEYKNEYVNCCTKLTYLVIIYFFLEEKVISFVSYLPARINYFRLKSLLLKISCLKKLKRPLPSRSVTAHVQTSIILRHKPINKK